MLAYRSFAISCVIWFAMLPALVWGQEYTVLVRCSPNSKVVQIRTDGVTTHVSDLVTDVAYFDANAAGDFICRSTKGEWFTGRVGRPGKLTPVTIPADLRASLLLALSHDGRSVAWVVQGKSPCRLRCTDVVSGHTVTLLESKIFLGEPAWSPDDKSLALNIGQPEENDLILSVLGVVDMTTDVPKVRELVEPFVLFDGLQATKPEWAPDGTAIRFMGRLRDGKEGIKPGMFHRVDKDGKVVSDMSGDDGWLADGIHEVIGWGPAQGTNRKEGKRQFVLRNVKTGVKEELRVDIGPHGDTISWSPDGALVAVVSEGGDSLSESVEIIDTRKNTRIEAIKAGRASNFSDLIWVTSRPATP